MQSSQVKSSIARESEATCFKPYPALSPAPLLVAAPKYAPAGALIGKYLLELERKSGVTVLGVK